MYTGMTFDSIPNALVAKSMINSFSDEEKKRRTQADTNKDFYYNKQADYVSLISHEQVPITVNLTRPIIKKRSTMLYQVPLVREITGPSQSVTFLEQVYADNDVDTLMLGVDLLTELTGTVLIHPRLIDTAEGIKVKLSVFDGSFISMIPSEIDPEVPSAVSIVQLVERMKDSWGRGRVESERVVRQQVWTDEIVVTYENGSLMLVEDNGLGFIPFSVAKGDTIPGKVIGDVPANGVRQLNHSFNQVLTDLGFTVRMQMASPIALEGYQSGEQITLNPGKAFSLPVGAKATVLDFKPKIMEALEVVRFLEEKMYETSSVPKVSVVGGEGASGRELLVRWFPLTQVFEEKSVRFAKYELDMANMVLKVFGLPPVTEISIDWPDEANLPFSAQEENLERDIKLGITTSAAEILRRNPDLSPDEAAQQAVANATLTSALMDVLKVDTKPESE